MTVEHQIVPGITLTAAGQANVEPQLNDILFDLAVQLEEPTGLPVDVEHVLAAIVLAASSGEIDRATPLNAADPDLQVVLAKHVKTVFTRFGGSVGTDD